MTLLRKIIGGILLKAVGVISDYQQHRANALLGGGKRCILYPFSVNGWHNICAEDNVHIGAGSTILCTRAKLIIKKHVVSGPGLTIITGDHMPIVGKFIDDVSDKDKDVLDKGHLYDKDIVIEEDVWLGANVTILKGVTIGRGSIIAAGAVVTNSIPRYSIAGGVPARVIKARMTEEEIVIHESILYQ